MGKREAKLEIRIPFSYFAGKRLALRYTHSNLFLNQSMKRLFRWKQISPPLKLETLIALGSRNYKATAMHHGKREWVFKSFQQKIVQMGPLQNSIQTLTILWPIYPIHTNFLFNFPLLTTSILILVRTLKFI